MLSQITRRSLSLVMALVLVFSLLPLGAMAEETEPQATTSETTSSTEATDPSVPETTIPETTSPEAAPDKADLALLREKMDAILLAYLGKTVMTDEEVIDIVNTMFWDDMQAALDKLNALDADFSPLTEEEIAQLEETYAGAETIVRFYETLQLAMTPSFFAAATGTHYPVTGVTVGVSGATDNSMSNGAITVTAKGSAGFIGIGASAKTATITVYNEYGNTATISFDWTATSVKQLNIDGAVYSDISASGSSGSFSKTIASGETFVITITTDKNSTTNTLVMSNFDIAKAADSSQVTFSYDTALGSITVGGTAVASGATQKVSSADGATLVATPKSGVTFRGWINAADGSILSTEASYTLFPAADMTVEAVFVGSGSSYFMIGSAKSVTYKEEGGVINLSSAIPYYTVSGTHIFDSLDAATAAAQNSTSSKVVVPLCDVTLTGSHTIPAGVTLLIPFDDDNTMFTTSALYYNTDTDYTKPTEYRTLTLADGAKITVNGSISVSGKHRVVQGADDKNIWGGAPMGALGYIRMQGSSSIEVNNGGALYAYGFITGSGSVVARSGASIYEIFQITDYRGGNQSSQMKNAVFPTSQYYVQNIEVPLTLHEGAKEYGYVTLNASSAYFPTAPNFIGGSESMFNISSGYVVKEYDGSTDRLKIKINGTVSLSSIELKLSSASINSEKYVLPLNGNITITIASGSSATVAQDIALIPGSQLIVEENASISLASGKRIYIYDGDNWGDNYCHGPRAFAAVPYAPSRTYTRTKAKDLIDAYVLVNGTIDASAGYVYTTGNGANVCSTGSGSVTLTPGAETITYMMSTNGTYVDIPITSAKLKHGDGTYVETEKYGAGTYEYHDGMWHTYGTGVVTAPTCTSPGYTTYTCKVTDCGHTKTDSQVAATGHTPGTAATCTTAQTCTECGAELTAALGHDYEAVVTAPTCTDKGYTTHTCSRCSDNYTDSEVAANGHNYSEWEVTTYATFDGPGEESRNCTVCESDPQTREISKLIAVAKIDDTRYETIAEAFENASTGCTVELLAAVTEDVIADCTMTVILGDFSESAENHIKAGDGFTRVFNADGTLSIVTQFKIYGTSVKAGDCLDMFFYVKKDNLVGTDYYAVVTKTFADGRENVVKTYPYYSSEGKMLWEEHKDYPGLVRFCFDDISAKEMTDEIYVTIYNGDGTPASREFTETIQSYAVRSLKTYANSTGNNKNLKLCTTLIDMLNYGAAAQQTLKYNDTDPKQLANYGCDDYQKFASRDAVCDYGDRVVGTGLNSTTIKAESNLTFRLFFDQSALPDTSYDVRIYYTDHYGTEYDETFENYTFKTDEAGLYGVDVTGLAIADGRQMIGCDIIDTKGEIVSSSKYSIECYIKDNEESVDAVYSMLMRFVDSAWEYFHYPNER